MKKLVSVSGVPVSFCFILRVVDEFQVCLATSLYTTRQQCDDRLLYGPGYFLTLCQLLFKVVIKECFVYPEKPKVAGHLCHVTVRTPCSIGPVEDGSAGDFGRPASTQCCNLVLQLWACLLTKHHCTSGTTGLL